MSDSSLSVLTAPAMPYRGETVGTPVQPLTGGLPSGGAPPGQLITGRVGDSAPAGAAGVRPAVPPGQGAQQVGANQVHADDQSPASVDESNQERPGRNDPLAPDELEQIVSSINEYLQSAKRSLEFSVDDSSGRTIIKVMDAEKEKVIRQIPPESILNLIERLRADGAESDSPLATGALAAGLLMDKTSA